MLKSKKRLRHPLEGRRKLAAAGLFLSLPLIIAFLLLARPPAPYYALPLAPIALAAVLYEFTGGALATLLAMAGVALLIALDPDATRRAIALQETWPIVSMYLVVGPMVGWLAAREREAARRLSGTTRNLHVVREITQAITTSLDLDRTLHTIIAETRRLAPFERAAVVLKEDDQLRVAAASAHKRLLPELVGRVFPYTGSATSLAARQARTWVGRSADMDRFPETRHLCPHEAGCLVVPLLTRHNVIGALILGGAYFTDPDGETIESLSSIGRPLAIAIEHARLFASEQQWARQMEAVNAASQEIAAALDLERTLRLVMAKAAETLPMDAGALFRFDPASQTYRVAVSHQLSPDLAASMAFDFEEGVPGWVSRHRQPLIIPDTTADRRVHPNVGREGIRSLLAVPLVARERSVGVLNLYARQRTNAFNEGALRLAEVFAAQAAYAIENAHLMDELRQAAAALEARVEERTQQLQASQAQAMLAEKMALIGRLAASVAHEVNNPLQAITLQLELIAEGQGLQEADRKRLAVVQEELTRISGIVYRLLDYQRPKPGVRSPQDISALLDDLLALSAKQLQRAGVKVIRDESPLLPPVLGVSDQIKQVFLNLTLNALEAMPQGGTLCVRAEQQGDKVVVSFSDTGLGMSPEVLERLFEPFFSTKEEGTGLGLTVSQEIVSQHAGFLEASSQPGQGTTFRVGLPACSPANGKGNSHG